MLPRTVLIGFVAACCVLRWSDCLDAAEGESAPAAPGIRNNDESPRKLLPDRIVVRSFVRRVGTLAAETTPYIIGMPGGAFDHAQKEDGKTLWWVNERQRFDKMVVLAPNSFGHLPANVRELLRSDPCSAHYSSDSTYHMLYALGEGYVAPFFGKLYRVEKSDGETFTLQAPRAEDLPRSVAVDPDSFAFPTATMIGYVATVRARPDVCDRDDQGPFADLTCYRQPKSSDLGKKKPVEIQSAPGEMDFSGPHTIRLRPGEYLETPECGLYRVRRVVPFDREARIWGWIEFDPLPTVPKNAEERAKLVIRRPVRK